MLTTLGVKVNLGEINTGRISRREFDRHQLDAEVEFVHPAEASGIAINLSAGGMRVGTDHEIRVGSTCIIVVRLNEREVVEHARVVWRTPKADGFVVGLQFLPEPAPS